jgi:hypothetical protein
MEDKGNELKFNSYEEANKAGYSYQDLKYDSKSGCFYVFSGSNNPQKDTLNGHAVEEISEKPDMFQNPFKAGADDIAQDSKSFNITSIIVFTILISIGLCLIGISVVPLVQGSDAVNQMISYQYEDDANYINLNALASKSSALLLQSISFAVLGGIFLICGLISGLNKIKNK